MICNSCEHIIKVTGGNHNEYSYWYFRPVSYTHLSGKSVEGRPEFQRMQDFGVNLICVEDGIDSSKDSGKLMISVLSAVAEIEMCIRDRRMAGDCSDRCNSGGYYRFYDAL